ncbi:MAG: hypothetical protein HY716_16935 [Planctomycetes bacterium]|nr:hypothetical protein [Planctomycetota bacterium]
MVRRTARVALAVVLIACGCVEPSRQNRAIIYVGGLQDLTHWDRINGGRGLDAYDALLALDPPASVPVLVASLHDPTPTLIDDRIHRPPTVGDVAFHMLLLIFGLKASDFEVEGVWIGSDPVGRNPIYEVHLDNDAVRERVKRRFMRMAIDRGWYEEAVTQ